MWLPHPVCRRARLGAGLILVALVMACGDDETETTPKECPGPCADGNVCTIDRCLDGECVSEPVVAGEPCGDEDVCNGDETCDADGACVAGPPIETDDGDPCTLDVCDPVTGVVEHPLEAECVLWEPMSEVGAPSARTRHSGVWTGSRFLVWGGSLAEGPAGDGAAYDPETDTWSAISSAGAPAARHSHLAVWTGERMLVWGGFSTQFENTGALYDPESDAWTPMSPSPLAGRTQMAFSWTGARLVVHGGITGASPFGDGASYDPATDAWEVLPAGGPSARYAHSVVTSSDGTLLFFGGGDTFDWLGDGTALSPAGAWSPIAAGGPSVRESHAALWTGSRMLVWGGWNGGDYKNDGGLYDPAAGEWTATSLAGAPSPRNKGAALWTGNSMFVWGGCGGDACVSVFGDGGLFTPSLAGGTWGALPSAGAPSARRDFAAAMADKRALVWGGRASSGAFVATGARARLFP
jgi:hypothetical protein